MREDVLDSFFNPRGVAIVGASKSAGKVGNSILMNVISSGFSGSVYPINPKENEIAGLKCHGSIADTSEVDLAIVAVPSMVAVSVAEECGDAGVKNLIVISAGFREIGKEGLELEGQLLDICRGSGMRMLGPNCLGMMNTFTPLNASFAARFPLKGGIAFISQSGALCTSILDWSLQRGIGFSKFVSLGNMADLKEADFIEDAASDECSKVIICYIEGTTEGKRFLRVAREAAKEKPVIMFKAGVTDAGARAASSHTGSLAGSDVAYETAFKQCGLIRARSMQELFDLAIAFSTQPSPRGAKVAIVTNAGGPGIMATDSIEANGLSMARFTDDTIKKLRAGLPPESNVYNPIDLIGDAREDRYSFALEAALADPNVDGAIVLLTPQAMSKPLDTAREIIKMKSFNKPILGVFMGGDAVEEGIDILTRSGIPTYPFPERAVASMAGLVACSIRRLIESDGPTAFDADKAVVNELIKAVRSDKRNVLLGSEAARIAESYGIPCAPSHLATKPEQAVEISERIGYPVALKIASPKILHKTDIGAVKLGLEGPAKVRAGFSEVLENAWKFMPEARIYGVEVQGMRPKGRELIIGATKDIQFGHMVMFGLGGVYANLIRDVSFRLAEGLTKRDIDTMLGETKAYRLLKGIRGEKQADIPAVADVIARVARLVMDFPEINELDINPLFAYEESCCAVDIKIVL